MLQKYNNLSRFVPRTPLKMSEFNRRRCCHAETLETKLGNISMLAKDLLKQPFQFSSAALKL
jgi:hypothetical protein